MSHFNHPKVDFIVREIARAQTANEQNDHGEARRILEGAATKARQLGIASACLHWHLAVTCDYASDFEAALSNVLDAIRLDPLSSPIRHSFDIVVTRLRTGLVDEEEGAPDKEVPRLYNLLKGVGKADLGCHVRMAKVLHGTGRTQEAAKLLEAVTLLDGGSTEAWSLRALIARALGDELAASEFDVQARATKPDVTNFAVPN
jgi:hypothetical protein